MRSLSSCSFRMFPFLRTRLLYAREFREQRKSNAQAVGRARFTFAVAAALAPGRVTVAARELYDFAHSNCCAPIDRHRLATLSRFRVRDSNARRTASKAGILPLDYPGICRG